MFKFRKKKTAFQIPITSEIGQGDSILVQQILEFLLIGKVSGHERRDPSSAEELDCIWNRY